MTPYLLRPNSYLQLRAIDTAALVISELRA
jgi:hypothetical protein